MALDIAAVQAALAEDGLDGWLLYDFHGSQPDRARAGRTQRRRQDDDAALVLPGPAPSGSPRGAGARHRAAHPRRRCPATKTACTRAAKRWRGASTRCSSAALRRVAMEYSPDERDPVSVARRCGHGGGDSNARRRRRLVRRSRPAVRGAVGRRRPLATHRRASAALYRIKDRALRRPCRERLAAGTPTTEYEIQQLMVRLVQGRRPHDRRARPSSRAWRTPAIRTTCRRPTGSRQIGSERAGAARSLGQAGHGRARCTPTSPGWGSPARRCPTSSPARSTRLPEPATRRSTLVEAGVRRRAPICAAGRSTARRARCCKQSGYGAHVLHRTGHSLGESVHGNGVHMDDYETHDDRRLLAGHRIHGRARRSTSTHFGVRTEVNMFVGDGEARVSGPCQAASSRSVHAGEAGASLATAVRRPFVGRRERRRR